MAQIGTKWFETVKFFVRGVASKGPPFTLITGRTVVFWSYFWLVCV